MPGLPVHFSYYQRIGLPRYPFLVNAFYLVETFYVGNHDIQPLKGRILIPGGISKGEIARGLIAKGVLRIVLLQVVRHQLGP